MWRRFWRRRWGKNLPRINTDDTDREIGTSGNRDIGGSPESPSSRVIGKATHTKDERGSGHREIGTSGNRDIRKSGHRGIGTWKHTRRMSTGFQDWEIGTDYTD